MAEQQAVDLVLRSRRIYSQGNWVDGGVAVQAGKVVGLGDASVLPPAREVVDVGDHVVLPGMIDTHVHLRDPGFTYKEDFTSGTRAAAVGGVTTIFDMPNVNPVPNTVDLFLAHNENARQKSIVDFGHNASGTIVEEIEGLARAGASTFKIFMMKDVGRDYPHMPGAAVDDHGKLYDLFEAIAATGRPVLLHPHNQPLYEVFVRRCQQEYGMGPLSYARAWRGGDGIVVDSGSAVALMMQRRTGVRLHLLHTSTIPMIDMIRRAKAEGQPVTSEVNTAFLFLTNSWANVERLGPFSLGMWIPEQHGPAVWEAVVDGTADVIGTDHGPHTKEEKEVGWTNMYKAPGGLPCIQHNLSLFLTAVNQGKLTMKRVVELNSENPAKLTDQYPRKGTIQVGSDADFVVLDMNRRETITIEKTLYKCGWTPYEGQEIQGVPLMTFLRGTLIAKDGEVLVEPGFGQFLRPE